MNNPPSGTVTFLFTDIEGSTKLAQEFPDTLPIALEKHHSIMHKAIESNNGFVFEVIGDAFCCAFSNVYDAINAAYDAQSNLAKEKWEEAVIRVRMGIHSGKAEWIGQTYIGYITLARTQRVMSAAYGEQILISNDVYELAKENISNKISFRDLGDRRLKDLIQPVKLHQIVAPGLQEDFPPLRTLDARPNNLPVQLTSFIGREEEMKHIKNLIKQTHLLTLTGSGGAGKTRLALQVAADIIDEFANGVWYVELATLPDPFLLPQSITKALGIQEQPRQKVEDTLIDYLKDKEILIILDNCEHIVEAVAKLTEKLLINSPDLKIIATSREALRSSGEQTHRILSLEAPDPRNNESPEKLTQYAAVRLFIERALELDAKFRVNNNNAPSIAGICYQLDGIPLAIELATARMKVLSVEKIYERLDHRFTLLTGGKRTALPRQQTLRAMIDWSYQLLPEKEKILWNRLSVFSGGWKLEAAEEICSDEKINKNEVFDFLSELNEKSLIIFNEEKESYSLPETIRQYGDEKLKETNEYEKFSEEHLKFYMKLTETAGKELRGNESGAWMKVLDNERGNIEKGLKWSIESSDNEDCIRLTETMTSYWQIRGYISEGIRWLETVLFKKKGTVNSSFYKIISHIGNFERIKGDFVKARKFLEESLKLSRESGDKKSMAIVLNRLGLTEYDQGRFEQAAGFYNENLKIYRETEDKLGISITLNNLGNVASNLGDYAKAYGLYEESLNIRRESGDNLGIGITLNNLGILAFEQGEYRKSSVLLQESMQIRREIGDTNGIGVCVLNLGNVAYNQGEYFEASNLYEEGLKIFTEIGDKSSIADSLNNIGKVALELEEIEKASKFFEESLAINSEIGAISQMAVSLYFLGRIEFRKNEYEHAKKYYYKSTVLYKDTGSKKDIALNILRLAELHGNTGNYVPAVKLLGFIKKEYFESNKIKFPKADQIVFDESKLNLKKKLNPEEFSKCFEEGKSITLEEAIGLALSNQ